jgi:hypothetical protein
MRSYRVSATAATFAGLAVLAGCSSDTYGGPATSSPATTNQTGVETHTPQLGAIEVSPGGVTTAVGAPAESTEEEYFQACHAAKVWMEQQGGDPKTLIEPYLASVQASGTPPSPATFGTPWAQLPPARQSAVIVAVQAAADQLCG